MKCITREVKMYTYIFANIDLSSGKAVNMETLSFPTPMGTRKIKEYCETHDNAVLIHKEINPVKYALPIEYFIEACEDYAVKASMGEVPAINPDDVDETDDDEE